MQSQNGMGGMNAQSLQDMQQRFLQQQQMQQQQQMHNSQAQMMTGNQFAGGINGQSLAAFGQLGGPTSNSALAMMQQQASTQSNAMMATAGGMNTNNNMMAVTGNWNTMAPASVSQSPMDASSGSSARLMASMGVGGMGNFAGNAKAFIDTSTSSMQNMQVLYQHQQQLQAQKMNQQSQIPNAAISAVRPTSSSSGQMLNENFQSQQQMMLQRQIANLQNQAQGGGLLRQESSQMNGMAHPQGPVAPSAEFLQAQNQHQFYQQGMAHINPLVNNNDIMNMMQQNPGVSQQPISLAGSMSGGGLISSRAQMKNNQNSMESVSQGIALGSFSEQHLRVPQQMTVRDASQLGADSHRQQQAEQLTSQNLIHHQQEPQRFSSGSVSSQQGSNHAYSNSPLPTNPVLNDASVRSHSSGSAMKTTQDNTSSDQCTSANSDQKAFLDGSFAGGWQSNADLPDRREVIFRILEVIRHMRPDTDRVSSKLPHMAKSLEEHLYRSAPTKEEYMDFGTLRRRLQAIAHGLELHRPSSSSSQQQGDQPLQTKFVESGQQASFQSTSSNDKSRYSSAIHANQASSNASINSGNEMGPANQSHMSSQIQQVGGQMDHSASFGSNLGGNASTQSSLDYLRQRQMSSQFQKNSNWVHAGSGNSISDSSITVMSTNSGMLPMGGMSLPQQQIQPPMLQHPQTMSSMMPSPPQIGNPMGPSMNFSQTAPQHWNSQSSSSSFWDSSGSTSGVDSSMQRKKVILQQQQRLLLLRHASKCAAGAACQTRFCSQMVTLWRHMKACRDKNCKTPHCVSSRCVLNHYRICKSNGKTASCEVCGPVMMKINQKEIRVDSMSTDPLTRDQDLSMQQAYQLYQQQSMVQQNSSGQMSSIQQQASMQPSTSQHIMNTISDGKQLQQVQQQQLKLKQQLDSLQQLQKKQEELEKQQKRLEMHAQQLDDSSSPKAQQLQQQQMLLRHLQKKCQQQQLMLQQEVKMIMSNGCNPQHEQNQLAVQTQIHQDQQHQQFHQQHMTQQQGSQNNPGLVPSHAFHVNDVHSSNLIEDGQTLVVGSRKSPAFAKHRLHGDKVRRGGKGKSLGIDAAISKKRLNDTHDEAYQFRKRTTAIKLGNESLEIAVGERKPLIAIGLDDTSLLTLMTRDEIMKHLESLNKHFCLSSQDVTKKCLPVIQALIDDQFGWVFHDAVDPLALGLPDYFDVVKTPMCLELVKKKLENATYNDTESFTRDLRLVFENAILYNGESSEVGQLAKSMLDKFHAHYRALVQGLDSSHVSLDKKGELCSLCGDQNRYFEPHVRYCQGECKMQQIQRHATCYTDRAKQNYWCDNCFKILDDDKPTMLDDGTEARRNDLQKCENDARPEEGWVKCDHCKSWMHQICSLFNGRVHKIARYSCPNCYLSDCDIDRAFSKQIEVAADLPHCKMSEAIESGLLATLEKAYKDRAEEVGLSIDTVEKAESLSIRVVSNTEKTHVVGEEMLMRYKTRGCVKDFPVRTKCVSLFQKIHGADTLLFAMYVYEYGHECPAPNRKRVYISYLDSVQYFEPKCYRTLVYHTVVVEYLRYVKTRGFHTAHIWSCPPTPSDDYIFNVHPSHQMMPRGDMLQTWFHEMLDRAKAEGIVIRTTTLYDEYFVKDGVDSVPWATAHPTCLPYFEGDYIPGEIEAIIRLEKKKNVIASDETSEDAVMDCLSMKLLKMKDNFIVVHLKCRRLAGVYEMRDNTIAFKSDSDGKSICSKRAKIIKVDNFGQKACCEVRDLSVHATITLSPDEHLPRSSEAKIDAQIHDAFERKRGLERLDGSAQEVDFVSACTTVEVDVGNTVDEKLPISKHDAAPIKITTSIAGLHQVFESDVRVATKGMAKEQSTAAPTGGDVSYSENRNDRSGGEKGKVIETRPFGRAEVPESKTSGETEEKACTTHREPTKNELRPLLNNTTSDFVEFDPESFHVGQAALQSEECKMGSNANEEQEGDCSAADYEVTSVKQNFVHAVEESKHVSETGNTQASKTDTLGSYIAANGIFSEKERGNGVTIETSKNDKQALISIPLIPNRATIKKETESSVRHFYRDGLPANPSEEIKGEFQVSGGEAINAVVMPANIAGEDRDEAPVPDCETIQVPDGKTLKVHTGPANPEGDINRGVHVSREILQMETSINRASEETNKSKISLSEAAAKNFTSDQDLPKAGDAPTSIYVGQRSSFNSDTDDQATDKNEAKVFDGVIKAEESHGFQKPECGIMESAKLRIHDVTFSKPQLRCPEEVNQLVEGPISSIGTSAQGSLKRSIEEVEPLLSLHSEEINSPSKDVVDTVDPDEPIEVELFESRQRFLNYCQRSHCQFDELRRAKHSTMMVLFQLHNPAAPLFLQQCGACYRDITHGNRYNCNNCSKFDLCEECFKPVTSGLWAKRDSRFEHDLSHTFTPIDMGVSTDSAMKQGDSQKALKAHCALLEHAGDCQGAPGCSLQNCQKMKKLFNHVRNCEIRPNTDCRICNRLISLCAIHARTCNINGSCSVPFCDRIRGSNERLQQQQQLMDNRRREAQNILYQTS